jgi:hypothetical protein
MMTTMIKRLFLLFLYLFLLSSFAHAQDDDFGIWYGINAETGLIKKLDLDIAASIRTFNKASDIDQAFVDWGLAYKLSKYLSASASYRLVFNREKDTHYYLRHKLYFDLKASLPVKNFTFSASTRFQHTTRTFYADNEDKVSRYYGRIKFKADYDSPVSFINPFITTSIYIPMFSGSGQVPGKMRYSAGVDMKITRKSNFEIEYIFQRDYIPDLSDIDIISLGYSFKF